MLLFANYFPSSHQWLGEATVAYIGEHHVPIQFPLMNQAGNSRTSSATVRGDTKLSHASGMVAEARKASTGTEMGSHIPSPLVPPFLKQE